MASFTIFMTAFALSMDAFAVSVGKGLSIEKLKIKDALIVGLWFGLFQAIMPLIGYFLGASFSRFIEAIDHWIAFILLAFIGACMIKESFSKEDEKLDASLSFKKMLPLAISTSIDALAAGVTFALTDQNIWLAISLIGVITMILSAVGVKIGNLFGEKYKSKAEFVGGVILILMGIKILIEGLFF